MDTLLPRLKARVAPDSGTLTAASRLALAPELSSGQSVGVMVPAAAHTSSHYPHPGLVSQQAQAVPLNLATREQLQAEVVALRQEMQLQGSSMREQLLVSGLLYIFLCITVKGLVCHDYRYFWQPHAALERSRHAWGPFLAPSHAQHGNMSSHTSVGPTLMDPHCLFLCVTSTHACRPWSEA